ncbi:uncharacterized protein LOC112483034 [Pteropus alecto]|uniref:uncharacterized protein LOC112483034 n=1 Tax=Pteropus alecto TaxID=9402 RepID=UPI000D5326C3|nr:uncharacterized protein LOC112483034 [Pteropus alecto]
MVARRKGTRWWSPRDLHCGHSLPVSTVHAAPVSISVWSQDGCVVNICPPPEEPSRDQPDDRKGLPWGAHFQLPLMLLEPDSEGHKSSKATPSKKPGNEDLLLRPPPLRILLTPPAQKEPSSLGLKGLVSKLGSPAGLQLGSPRQAAEALKEMAVSTKSIALIAATRRSKAQDREAGSHRSPHHPPEGRRGPSPVDGGWPCTSCSRGSSVERKARTGRSPALTQSLQQVGGRWSWWSSPRGPAERGVARFGNTSGERHLRERRVVQR